jgi:hypothetical protein
LKPNFLADVDAEAAGMMEMSRNLAREGKTLTSQEHWHALDYEMYRLCRVLSGDRDDLVGGSDWAPTRAQVKRLLSNVYNGADVPEAVLAVACERYRSFM